MVYSELLRHSPSNICVMKFPLLEMSLINTSDKKCHCHFPCYFYSAITAIVKMTCRKTQKSRLHLQSRIRGSDMLLTVRTCSECLLKAILMDTSNVPYEQDMQVLFIKKHTKFTEWKFMFNLFCQLCKNWFFFQVVS